MRLVHRFGSSFSGRLLMVVTLALAPAFALIIYTGVEQRRDAIQQAQENALQTGQAIAFQHQMWMVEIRSLLISTSQIPLLREEEPSFVCDRFLAGLVSQSEVYTSFQVVNGEGSVICASDPVLGSDDPLERSWFRRVIEARDMAIGDYQVDSNGNAGIVFAYPLLDANGQNVDRILAMAVSLQWINQRAAQLQLPPDSTVTVIDSNGTVLSKYPESEPWIGTPAAGVPVVDAVLRLETAGTISGMAGLDDTERLYGFVPFGGLRDEHPLRIIVGIPEDAAAGGVASTLRRNLVGLTIVATLSLAVGWFIGEAFLMRQVRALVEAARRLATGDLSARSGLRHDTRELGQVADAFDHMAMALEQRETERAEAEQQRVALAREQAARATAEAGQQQLRTLVDMSPAGVFVIDATTRKILLANQEWRRIHGVPSNEKPTPMHLARVVYRRTDGTAYAQEERPESRALFEGQMTMAEQVSIEGPDGRMMPALVSATPLVGPDGQVQAAVVVLQDTSRLQEVERMRNEFLGMVGHELRSPLAVIKMVVDSLQLPGEHISPKEITEAAETIDQQVDRLLRLVENLRDAVQIEAGVFSVDPEPQDIMPALQEAQQYIEQGSNLRVALNAPAGPLTAPIDQPRFLQVMQNLLNNAARYSPQETPIQIGVKRVDHEWVVSVTNRGPGIPKEQQAYLFRKFSQLSQGERSNQRGTSGLGLSICKGIVEAHGGRIWVESSADARETTFAFTLPMERHDQPRHEQPAKS